MSCKVVQFSKKEAQRKILSMLKTHRSVVESDFCCVAKNALRDAMNDKNKERDFLYIDSENPKEQIMAFLDCFITMYEKLLVYKQGKKPRPDNEILPYLERYKISTKTLDSLKKGKLSKTEIDDITNLLRINE